MTSVLIQAWLLESGSFSDGLDLYRQIRGDLPVSYFEKQLYQPYVNPFVKQKLRERLESYLLQKPPTKNNLQQPPIHPEENTKKIEPLVITGLRSEAKALHKRHSYLHAKLTIVQSNQERFELAKMIMEKVIPALDDIYDQIREWESTGTLPNEPDHDQEALKKGALMYKKLESLRPRISKLKKWIQEGKRGSTVLNTSAIAEYEAEKRHKEEEVKTLLETLGL